MARAIDIDNVPAELAGMDFHEMAQAKRDWLAGKISDQKFTQRVANIAENWAFGRINEKEMNAHE